MVVVETWLIVSLRLYTLVQEWNASLDGVAVDDIARKYRDGTTVEARDGGCLSSMTWDRVELAYHFVHMRACFCTRCVFSQMQSKNRRRNVHIDRDTACSLDEMCSKQDACESDS